MDWAALGGGAVAGTVTDIALYPLDTLKTRLQSPEGFIKAGGFRGTYKGLGAAAIGSAPGAALFFATYEMSKRRLQQETLPLPATHMLSAAAGETMACLVRVPTEVVKQRMQAGVAGYASVTSAVSSVLRQQGIGGFYAGFGITLMRELPFAFIQFPLYEALKTFVGHTLGRTPSSAEAAVCGSVSGGIAAAITTPLDVAKTRLMLGRDAHGVEYRGALDTLRRLRLEGWGAMFAGVTPRVTWISIGGFVFFGAYEAAHSALVPLVQSKR